MTQSESIKEIATALAKSQARLAPVLKDKTARVQSDKGNYTFDYADLASVLEACRTALNEQQIALVQGVETEPTGIKVETRLIHSSGEWLACTLSMRANGDRPQLVGSAITYARRYALSAMVGLASEEDDDANGAEGNQREISQRPAPSKPAPKPETKTAMTPPHVVALWTKVKAHVGEAKSAEAKKAQALFQSTAEKWFKGQAPPSSEWTVADTEAMSALIFNPPDIDD